MWFIETEPAHALPDVARFVNMVNANAGFFQAGEPIVVGRAPGRLDLMGGIADYSGALVLELPLAAATFVAAQPDPAPFVTVLSMEAAAIDSTPQVVVPLAQLAPPGQSLDYAAAHALLTADPRTSWAAYVIGTLVVLQRECGLQFHRGLRLLVDSSVPPGKGVSSSAAIEVAAMSAICTLYGIEIPGRELAILCQMVENLVVGAPCGVMDQMTAACGEQDRLLALLCQPAELAEPVGLPPQIAVFGIDSGIRHAVSGADYGSVRVGAFMGYRIIAELAGLAVNRDSDGALQIVDPRWHGYLANIPPSVWETQFRNQVPETISGAEFLERYGGTTDRVTRIDPRRLYAVRQPAAHPIYEHQRVRLFAALLRSIGPHGPSEEHLQLLGELMYQSHASYSACGLGSTGTDRLVELVRAAGPASGLYGAKITGGGSGGTVAVLGRQGADDLIHAIAAEYQNETGRNATLIGGSSPGAVQFGAFRLM